MVVMIRLGDEEKMGRRGVVGQKLGRLPAEAARALNNATRRRRPGGSLRAGFQGPGSLKKCPLPMLPCCPGGVVRD